MIGIAQALLSLLLRIIVIREFAEGITITRLSVPTPLAVGDGGVLECDWSYDGDHVYTLKWYQGQREFYRWTPQENPPVKVFAMDSRLSVDLSESDGGRVKIHNVTLKASGPYRCEVSGEAPVFETSQKWAVITVVDLPDERPLISGAGVPFQLLDVVNLNCSSYGAKPAPELTFYLNDVPVDPEWMTSRIITEDPSTGLESVWRGLHFHLRESLVRRGQVKVKCVSSYPDLYWESNEVTIQVDGVTQYEYSWRGYALTDVAPSHATSPVLLSLIFLRVLAIFI